MTDDLPPSDPANQPAPLHLAVEERLAQMEAEIVAAEQRGFEAGRDAAEALLLNQVEYYKMLVTTYDEEVKRLRGKLKNEQRN